MERQLSVQMALSMTQLHTVPLTIQQSQKALQSNLIAQSISSNNRFCKCELEFGGSSRYNYRRSKWKSKYTVNEIWFEEILNGTTPSSQNETE